MSQLTAKVLRVTATGTVRTDQITNVIAVQVLGGTAETQLFDATSAVAADLKMSVTGGTELVLNNPVRFRELHVVAGASATDILIHYV